MKLIEALKKVKYLKQKHDDIRMKIAEHSAYLSNEQPVYPNQKEQVAEWVQACHDILKEVLKLRIAIQRTNLATEVTIEFGGQNVTKTIAEWIHRRRDLADSEAKIHRSLTDKRLREGHIKQSTGEMLEVHIVRCYDPKTRDVNVELYTSEPFVIDGRLEVVNAVTDLIED